MRFLYNLLICLLIMVFAIGVTELGCWFHDPSSAIYIGKVSYRCK